jgi:hypothetical protein
MSGSKIRALCCVAIIKFLAECTLENFIFISWDFQHWPFNIWWWSTQFVWYRIWQWPHQIHQHTTHIFFLQLYMAWIHKQCLFIEVCFSPLTWNVRVSFNLPWPLILGMGGFQCILLYLCLDISQCLLCCCLLELTATFIVLKCNITNDQVFDYLNMIWWDVHGGCSCFGWLIHVDDVNSMYNDMAVE